MSYGFQHEGRAFYPDGRPPTEEPAETTEQRHRARSAAEVELFRERTADRWFAYVKDFGGTHYGTVVADGELTTWTGDRLATFVWADFSDESREPRGCPKVYGFRYWFAASTHPLDCDGGCNGTGRLEEGAEPDIEVNDARDGSWWWRFIRRKPWNHGGPYPTEAEALAAAREAARRGD